MRISINNQAIHTENGVWLQIWDFVYGGNGDLNHNKTLYITQKSGYNGIDITYRLYRQQLTTKHQNIIKTIVTQYTTTCTFISFELLCIKFQIIFKLEFIKSEIHKLKLSGFYIVKCFLSILWFGIISLTLGL